MSVIRNLLGVGNHVLKKSASQQFSLIPLLKFEFNLFGHTLFPVITVRYVGWFNRTTSNSDSVLLVYKTNRLCR